MRDSGHAFMRGGILERVIRFPGSSIQEPVGWSSTSVPFTSVNEVGIGLGKIMEEI